MDSEIADVAPQARNTVEMHLQYDAHQVKAGETLTKSQVRMWFSAETYLAADAVPAVMHTTACPIKSPFTHHG